MQQHPVQGLLAQTSTAKPRKESKVAVFAQLLAGFGTHGMLLSDRDMEIWGPCCITYMQLAA